MINRNYDERRKACQNQRLSGWGRVLDYVGIEWKDPAHWWLAPNQLEGQMTLFDFIGGD